MNGTTRLSPDQIEQDIEETRRHIDETIDSLQRKLSPGTLLHVAADYARENGSVLASNSATMAANAGRTVRDNPIPLALLGIGLAWLMIGQRRGAEDQAYPSRTAYSGDGAGRAGDMAETAWENTRGKAARMGDAASSAGARAQQAAARAGDAASSARTRAGEAASAAAHRVGEAASGIRSSAQAGVSRLKSGAAGAATAARERASHLTESASRAARTTGRYAQEHPLATGAVMLAAGALLAAMLPRTRQEDEWAGEASDDVKATAREQASEFAQRGKDAASAAMSAAKAEAERKDISPDRAKREAASIVDAGGDVAVSAAQAAQREFKRDGGHSESGSRTEDSNPARRD